MADPTNDPWAAIRTLNLSYQDGYEQGGGGESGNQTEYVPGQWTADWDSLKPSGFQSKYNQVEDLGDGRLAVTLQRPGSHKYDTLKAIYSKDPTTGQWTLQGEPEETRTGGGWKDAVDPRQAIKDGAMSLGASDRVATALGQGPVATNALGINEIAEGLKAQGLDSGALGTLNREVLRNSAKDMRHEERGAGRAAAIAGAAYGSTYLGAGEAAGGGAAETVAGETAVTSPVVPGSVTETTLGADAATTATAPTATTTAAPTATTTTTTAGSQGGSFLADAAKSAGKGMLVGAARAALTGGDVEQGAKNGAINGGTNGLLNGASQSSTSEPQSVGSGVYQEADDNGNPVSVDTTGWSGSGSWESDGQGGAVWVPDDSSSPDAGGNWFTDWFKGLVGGNGNTTSGGFNLGNLLQLVGAGVQQYTLEKMARDQRNWQDQRDAAKRQRQTPVGVLPASISVKRGG